MPGLRSGASDHCEPVAREAVWQRWGLYSKWKEERLRRGLQEEKEPCWTKNEMSKDTDVMMKIGRKCPNPDFPFA